MSVRKSSRASWAGPIVDLHVHPMLEAEPVMGSRPHSPADYLRAVQGLHVLHAGALVIAPRSNPTRTRLLNDRVIALEKETDGRFYAVCSVHPKDGATALEEVDRIAKEGVRMLKLHPNTQEFDVSDAEVLSVVKRAAARNVVVLFDAYSPFDANQPGKFVRLALEVPEARLVLAHAHGPRFPDLLVYEALSRYPWWQRNVWIELSATAPLMADGPMAETFAWVLRKVGIDRLLFGSDYPMDDPRAAVDACLQFGFSRAELERVFFRNAVDLLRLPGPKR